MSQQAVEPLSCLECGARYKLMRMEAEPAEAYRAYCVSVLRSSARWT
jgi:hypothetical protein